MSTHLVMYRGDDRDFPLTITEEGLPLDLTDYTVKATFREDIDDVDYAFQLDSTVALDAGFEIDVDADQSGAGKGKIILHVRNGDTSALERGTTLIGDIELTDGDGLVRTAPEPAWGESTLIKLKIRADVTHA